MRKEIKTTTESGYPLLLTARPASKLSGVPEHMLRQLVSDGLVKTVRAGNRRYINMESLYEYLTREDSAAV